MNKILHRGFTLVELITIILVIGVISIFAAPRFFNTGVFEDRAATDQIIAAARFAQQLAMTRGVNHRLILGANTYRVERVDGTPVPNPNGSGNYAVTLAGNTTLTTATPNITFNSLGQASFFDAGGNPVLAPNTTITAGGFTVTVEGETGYAHL